MKIIIESNTQEDAEKVFKYIKTFCIENFQEFELEIEGRPDLKHKQEVKHG